MTSCLPHFFILGEMKCGTTSLYHFLTKHPRVVVPRVKEPRFLQPGRFAQSTVSRYERRSHAQAHALTRTLSRSHALILSLSRSLALTRSRSHALTTSVT